MFTYHCKCVLLQWVLQYLGSRDLDRTTTMIYRKMHLAISMPLFLTIGFGSFTAHATNFSANAVLENTLSITNVRSFNVGRVYASVTGTTQADGVGALVVAPDGGVTDPADSSTVTLTSLSAPVPAQGSVGMAANFELQFPNTSTIEALNFNDGAAGLGPILTTNGIKLVHESANPNVPSLYLMHFTVGDVSGGTVGRQTIANDGRFPVVASFGESTYVFNVGATLTTEPSDFEQPYQRGVYSGTFTVTGSY